MNDLAIALTNILNLLKTNVYEPILSALDVSSFADDLILYLNSLINGLFKFFNIENVLSEQLDYGIIAWSITLLVLILIIVFMVNLFKFAFDFIKESVKFRRLKRKKWKDFSNF